MEDEKLHVPIPDEIIMNKIFLIRGREDFLFELTLAEFENLRCQFDTSIWESTRYAPMAFTDHGVVMLASILKSERAIEVNIRIIRIYNKMREILSENQDILKKLEKMQTTLIKHENSILTIADYLKQLEKENQIRKQYHERKRIGYK